MESGMNWGRDFFHLTKSYLRVYIKWGKSMVDGIFLFRIKKCNIFELYYNALLKFSGGGSYDEING